MLTSGTASGLVDGGFATTFWNPVTITPDTFYYLVFTSSNNDGGLAGDTSNPYPRGQVYANPGYGSFPTFDYTFQTFYTPTSSVPEPGTLALLAGMGLSGAGFLARRRKNARQAA